VCEHGEHKRALQVGHLQKHVADVNARINRSLNRILLNLAEIAEKGKFWAAAGPVRPAAVDAT
jgi:hypothetical protein